MTSDNVIVEKYEGVGRITPDRPPLNIITIDMCRAVTAAIESMDKTAIPG
jgi:enoyl-CoA hydratase/carnithine racemase